MIPGYLDQAHRSKGRARTESMLRAAGLVQAAGGTKYRYFTTPERTEHKTGYFWRTSARTLRLVRRVRVYGKIHDQARGGANHGELQGDAWALRAATAVKKHNAKLDA